MIDHDFIYSIRMRAAAGGPHERGGRHVSGAERLVSPGDAVEAAGLLIRRAIERGPAADFIQVTLDRIPSESLKHTRCLPITLCDKLDPAAARGDATIELASDVSRAAVDAAFEYLADTRRAPCRGAIVLDCDTGTRIDDRGERGVRAGVFDYAERDLPSIHAELARLGLGHFRTFEALAVATKVQWAGFLGELCWSDEPDYVAGYCTTIFGGYVRYATFKPVGAPGGRVFFSTAERAADAIYRVENAPLLITMESDYCE